MTKLRKRGLPPRIVILETLEKNGRVYEEELQETLNDTYGAFPSNLLSEELMRLEVQGLVIVSESGTRKGKIIELPKKKRYVKIGEE